MSDNPTSPRETARQIADRLAAFKENYGDSPVLAEAILALRALTADLAQARQERDAARESGADIHFAAGFLLKLKAECEAQHARAEAAEQARDEAQLRPDPLGVIDLVDDQRLQIQVRDEALLAIRRACGPDGHRVDLAGIAPLIVELLQSATRTALLEAAEEMEVNAFAGYAECKTGVAFAAKWLRQRAVKEHP